MGFWQTSVDVTLLASSSNRLSTAFSDVVTGNNHNVAIGYGDDQRIKSPDDPTLSATTPPPTASIAHTGRSVIYADQSAQLHPASCGKVTTTQSACQLTLKVT
jgi:hypothetical protein